MSGKIKHKVFVYGTLRDGAKATHFVDDYMMFKVSGATFDFPFIQEWESGYVVGNVIEVNNKRLAELDRYEGVANGLYNRIKLPVYAIDDTEPQEVWAYVAGPQLTLNPIQSGDWLNRE